METGMMRGNFLDAMAEMENDISSHGPNTEDKIIQEMRSNSYRTSIVGQKFDNGYTIDPRMALPIIRTYAPEKEDIHADLFTIDTIKKDTFLIAMLKDHTVVYTIPLVKELREPVISLDYEKTLEAMRDTSNEYKKIQVRCNVTLAIAVILALAFYAVVYYFTAM